MVLVFLAVCCLLLPMTREVKAFNECFIFRAGSLTRHPQSNLCSLLHLRLGGAQRGSAMPGRGRQGRRLRQPHKRRCARFLFWRFGDASRGNSRLGAPGMTLFRLADTKPNESETLCLVKGFLLPNTQRELQISFQHLMPTVCLSVCQHCKNMFSRCILVFRLGFNVTSALTLNSADAIFPCMLLDTL